MSLTDGSSNTILTGEGGAINCSDPDISADGRFVVYQGDKNGTQAVLVDRQAFGNELLLTPASATLGTDFVTILNGLHPSISDDGRFVAYVAGIAGGPNQIALYDRDSQSTTLISKSPGGLRADKACVGPVLSGDGNLLFFSSNASNLVGGQGGLFVFDLRTEVMTRLGNPSAFPCSVSSDGRWVAANVDNRLRLIDRQNNTNVEVPGLVAFVPLGAPALSGDGRFLTFYSNRADLVSNDANKQTDVFVLDLLTQRISRVNLSGDGVATQGGVDALLTQGPAISRDGTRIAFASADELLVPNDSNRSIDVFSSSNPTGGRLYVATSTGRILRFDNVAGANGALTAAATLTSPLLTGSPRVELFLDTFNDRLYAAAGTLSNSRLLVFDNVSTLNGDVVPRFRAIGASFPGLFVDVANDLLYRGNTLFSNASGLGAPVRTLSAERPTQILVDSRFNEWMLGQGASVRVFPAGLTGAPTLARTLTARGATSCGIQFDVSPPGTPGFNNSNLFVLGEGPALGSTPDAGLNSLVHLSRTSSPSEERKRSSATSLRPATPAPSWPTPTAATSTARPAATTASWSSTSPRSRTATCPPTAS